jgi:hypothetical protein
VEVQGKLFDSGPVKEPESARDLTADWVDAVTEKSGFPPPKQTISRMAKVIKDLLETHPPDLIRKTLLIAADEGRPPAGVADLMLRVQTQGTQMTVRDWVRQHGWPTGSRFQRGANGATYVPDPLGYDKPPYKVPWAPPSVEELRRALAAREDSAI